jgi:phosphatidate cytidylyltransferase
MLAQRVVTAVVLLAVLAGVIASGSATVFGAFVGITIFAAIWETSRLLNQKLSNGSTILLAVGCLIFFGWYLVSFRATSLSIEYATLPLYVAAVFWIAVAPRSLLAPQRRIVGSNRMIGFVAGSVLVACAFAVIYLYRRSYELLAVVLLIPIVADTFAYFVGRAIGKHKLAPAISPGKTIEGAVGGLVAVALIHGAWVISQGWRWWWIAIFVVLGVFSIIGDLFESLLKRQAGVKDSSNLLPGHGGVLDRIDAQLPVLPLAALAFHYLPLK